MTGNGIAWFLTFLSLEGSWRPFIEAFGDVFIPVCPPASLFLRDLERPAFLLKCPHAQHIHFLLREEPPVATTYILLRQTGELYTVELDNAIAETLEDATDDAVFAAVDFDAHLCLVLWVGIFNGISLDLTVLKLDAVRDFLQVVGCDRLVEEHMIDLLLQELGMGKL